MTKQPPRAKIVHLTSQLVPGGAEGQLCLLAKELHDRGWPQVVVSFAPGGAWTHRLTDIGIPTVEIPPARFKPRRLWQFNCLVRRERPGIVLSWSAYKTVYARWMFGAGRPAKIFNLRNDLTLDSNTGSPTGLVRWLRGTLNGMDCTISNTRQNLEILIREGVRPRHSEVIRNMVVARGRARPGEKVRVPRILGAAALKPLKAYDVLLQALRMLRSQDVEFEFLLAGDGAERQRLEAMAGEFGLGDRVKFLGTVDDVPALLASGHLLVHPSRTEGLSNTILEAMAEGLPVVATAVGGTPEILEDGRTGLLVPPGSPCAIADALRKLLRDAALRQRLGQAALRHVQATCSESTIVHQYERLFCRLLGAEASDTPEVLDG